MFQKTSTQTSPKFASLLSFKKKNAIKKWMIAAANAMKRGAGAHCLLTIVWKVSGNKMNPVVSGITIFEATIPESLERNEHAPLIVPLTSVGTCSTTHLNKESGIGTQHVVRVVVALQPSSLSHSSRFHSSATLFTNPHSWLSVWRDGRAV